MIIAIFYSNNLHYINFHQEKVPSHTSKSTALFFENKRNETRIEAMRMHPSYVLCSMDYLQFTFWNELFLSAILRHSMDSGELEGEKEQNWSWCLRNLVNQDEIWLIWLNDNTVRVLVLFNHTSERRLWYFIVIQDAI